MRISTHPSSVVGLVFSLHRYTAQIHCTDRLVSIFYDGMVGAVSRSSLLKLKVICPEPNMFWIVLVLLGLAASRIACPLLLIVFVPLIYS